MILSAATAYADSDIQAVYKQQIDKPLAEVYGSLYKSLENARFFVVFEPNIGENLARFSGKWGDDYNRNNISAIRSMVFCNGWYANEVSNLDPDMLGFCPLHITLFEQQGITTVLFNLPGTVAEEGPAKKLLMTIEKEVIEAIRQGLL
ncbi:MAG: DUF302 domain-containing protein [Gammaproteobacteria bacterium]|nr:DUF302 domain-containing protein [Gammaproteobacteria bacterium]MBT8133171.1 DUF302 domain-containing protein [Gammaproteobacteria bacterium]NNJ51481.1 DUF302 domain-containing protein [Gammaproteobacteria bacterium]